MSQRWLRQLGSGTIYHYTETLAKRRDMVEESEETVNVRIATEKRIASERATAALNGISEEKDALQRLQEKSAELTRLQEENEAAKNLREKRDEVVSALDPSAINSDDLVKRDRVMSQTEIEEEDKSRKLAMDKEYQSILVMKSRDAILNYLQEHFGVIPGEKLKIEQLRVLALTKRAERMFEGK